MNGLIAFFATLLLATSAFGQNCPNAKFSDVKALASADARLNTETAYTVEFKVNCGKFVPLYAEVNGVFLASSWDITGTKYQVTIYYYSSSRRNLYFIVWDFLVQLDRGYEISSDR